MSYFIRAKKLDKQIELLEDAVLVQRGYVDGIQIYTQDRIKRELEHMKQRRKKLSSFMINEYKFFN